MKHIRQTREVAAASHGVIGGKVPAVVWDARTQRKTIARLARDIERLKAKRRKARKVLDSIEDELRDAKRLYRDVIADVVEPSIDTSLPLRTDD